MNTQSIITPRLHHYGLTTANVDAMVDWYEKVLGMTVNYRASLPWGAPFSAMAFVSNDDVNHRIVFFEIRRLVSDPEKARHIRVQHIAFNYGTLDDLLGTYVRLKNLDILPVQAVDEGVGISLWYLDPDENNIELNALNYDSDSATEIMKSMHVRRERPSRAFFDPEKMIEARLAGVSPWELHEEAVAGKLAPAKPYDNRAIV